MCFSWYQIQTTKVCLWQWPGSPAPLQEKQSVPEQTKFGRPHEYLGGKLKYL